MRADEREMLRGSLRRLLSETDPAKVPAALDGFGFMDLLATDPAAAIPELFEAQGEGLVSSPMLSTVMASPLAAVVGGHSELARCAVLLPGPGAGAEPRSTLLGGGAVELDGYAVTGATEASTLLLAARADEAVVVAAGRLDRNVEIAPVNGIDPDLGLVRFRGRLDAPAIAEGVEAGRAWNAAVAAGRRALAHELVGQSRTMLAMAVQHAGARYQFNRPIGSFQALKHRLAEAKVALTAAEAASAEAWAPSTEEAAHLGALLAKLWAGRAARVTGRHAQQALGGIGFTWEHGFHRYVRRTLVFDSILGSATELQSELGRRLLATGVLPQLASL